MVEAILTGHNVAIVGRQASIPVDFFLKDAIGKVKLIHRPLFFSTCIETVDFRDAHGLRLPRALI